jgi:hypothetical protein
MTSADVDDDVVEAETYIDGTLGCCRDTPMSTPRYSSCNNAGDLRRMAAGLMFIDAGGVGGCAYSQR